MERLAAPLGGLAVLYFAASTLASLAATLMSVWAVAALGLAAFGITHVIIELRYVIGRFSSMLRGAFAWWLFGLTSLVFVARALASIVPVAAVLEIVAGMATVALGCWVALGGAWRLLALLVCAAATIHAIEWPGQYFFVLTHLHNLVPLAFLWDWSRRLGTSQRRYFLGMQLVWVVLIPLGLLLAAPSVESVPGWLDARAAYSIWAGATPPGLRESGLTSYLSVFAFMQTMHYAVWIGFLPWAARDASAAFSARVPLLKGGRVWWLAAGCALVLAGMYCLDYLAGRSVYGLLATYHVYVELPLIVVLAAGCATRRAGGPH